MLFTTNIIKFPFISILDPHKSKFTSTFKQGKLYQWIYGKSLNSDIYGNELLEFNSEKQKVIFKGSIDNPAKRFLKFNFSVNIKLSNGYQFTIADTKILFHYQHFILSKKLKLNGTDMKKFQFQPYLDKISLSMVVEDNSRLDDSDVKLTFTDLGFDLVNL